MKILSEAAPQPAAILEGYEAVDCEKEGESTKDYEATDPLPPVPSEAGPKCMRLFLGKVTIHMTRTTDQVRCVVYHTKRTIFFIIINPRSRAD